jgi:hypothetical protein
MCWFIGSMISPFAPKVLVCLLLNFISPDIPASIQFEKIQGSKVLPIGKGKITDDTCSSKLIVVILLPISALCVYFTKDELYVLNTHHTYA